MFSMAVHFQSSDLVELIMRGTVIGECLFKTIPERGIFRV